MARRKHRDDEPEVLVDEDPDAEGDDEEEDDDEDDEEEDDDGARDFAMARLAAARASAQVVLDAIDEVTFLFVMPDGDERGKQRKALLDAALEASGDVSRSLEAAHDGFQQMDKEDFAASEPE